MRLCREISAGQYRPPGISAATRGAARSCPRRRCSGPCPRGSPSSPPVPAPVGQPSGAAGERYLFTHLFTHSPQLPGRGRTEQHYLNGSPNHTSAGQNRFGWSGIIFVKGHLSDFNPWSGVRDPGGPLAEHQAKGMLRIAGPPRGPRAGSSCSQIFSARKASNRTAEPRETELCVGHSGTRCESCSGR